MEGRELGLDCGVGGAEKSELGGLERIDAEEVVFIGGRLASVVVDLIGAFGAADRLEEDAGEAGEGAEALGVTGSRIVERVDEELAEEFGDVFVVESAGVATDAAAGGGAALAAALGKSLLVGGIVE
jgi:hypothetical protein